MFRFLTRWVSVPRWARGRSRLTAATRSREEAEAFIAKTPGARIMDELEDGLILIEFPAESLATAREKV